MNEQQIRADERKRLKKEIEKLDLNKLSHDNYRLQSLSEFKYKVLALLDDGGGE